MKGEGISTGETPWMSRLFYIAAVIVVLLGLVLLLSSISASAAMPNQLLGLRIMGGEILANLLIPILRNAVLSLGIAGFVISLVLGTLLYGLGRFSARTAALSARVARLEARLEAAQGGLAGPPLP